ncbi:hypothetical protein COL93_20415 [Bacillus toyonensis]|uniref:Uncharacterized protein n=1 Tax=Bacillus toyonensis TaxID=155322 RepID=A0A2C4QML8_9BACI|nr:hypothetical protein COL93_20415 [Bacillus toyonensis]PHD65720.1 hypothetical protein COF40_22600 [Bacillus toyonensis]
MYFNGFKLLYVFYAIIEQVLLKIKKRHPKVPSSDLNHFHFNNMVLSLKTIGIFPVGFVSSFYEIMSVFYFVFQ